jgi:hypothetical protein
MSETITLQALDLSGETLTMFLRKADGTLLNTGGDAGTESGSTGVFTFTLAESRAGLGPLAVRVCVGSETAENLLYDGFLVEGSTVIDSTVAAVLDPATIDAIADAIGTTGGGDWTDTEKAQIRYRLGLDGTATAPEDPDEEPIVITPGSGSFTTGYVTCFDQDGTIFPDCTLYQRMIEAPSGDVGYAYDSSQTSVTSANNGVAQFPNLVKGATYLFFRGKESEGSVLTIPTSAGATYALPSIVGR